MTIARWARHWWSRFLICGLAGSSALCFVLLGLIVHLDQKYPLPLDDKSLMSIQVLDRNGKLLRAFANREGRWRLPVRLTEVDQDFVDLLIAYEDQRFYSHLGVDPLAMIRAGGQFIRNRRIVSGGSTLTMQLARLLEAPRKRSLSTKLLQMARAIQLERHLTKQQILTAYLNRAPYGGNLEGVRTAALSYFGKEPAHLELQQAALLVALPQAPETRRPDRFATRAKLARDRVVARAAKLGKIDASEQRRVARFSVPDRRLALPYHAAHLAEAARGKKNNSLVHRTTLDVLVQKRLENLAKQTAIRLPPRVSLAMIMADSVDGKIIASLGAADPFDEDRTGWIDMGRAYRSPGSTLKPLIYGLAFDQGLIRDQTLLSDRPSDFDGYRPANFDSGYRGDVTARRALQLSLNVPAVQLLDGVGAVRLRAAISRAGVALKTPRNADGGLSIGLGGGGLRLVDLVQLYVNLIAVSNKPLILGDNVHMVASMRNEQRMLTRTASWRIMDILAGLPHPRGQQDLSIAYKTGTSYGYRDAFAIGFDGRYVIGVWVGRADNGVVPGMTGANTAAPILFAAFGQSGRPLTPLPAAPAGVVTLKAHQLPTSLQRFAPATASSVSVLRGQQGEEPRIVFPRADSEVELINTGANPIPLALKLNGGRPPFRLLANGRLQPQRHRQREIYWQPDQVGATRLTVLDANGAADTIEFYIAQPTAP